MIVHVEIPDDIIEEGRAIHIMAGMEQVAYWLPWEKVWRVKYSRCNLCGKCCLKADCEYLADNGECLAARSVRGRPFGCSTSEPKTIPDCTSRYKEV